MTSVQSHQRRLSGNKLLSYIACMLILTVSMSSCDLFSTKSTRTVKKRPTERPKERADKKDKEVIVIEKNDSGTPVKDADEIIVEIDRPHKKSSYAIDMYLPVDKQYFDDDEEVLNSRNEHYMQFALGASLAIENASGTDIKLNIKKDTKLSSSQFNIGNKPDIIVAGSSSESVLKLAQLAAEKRITVVSPFLPLSDVTTSNPFFIQAMPDLESYCRAMTIDAFKKYPNADFHVLGPESVSDRFKYFQNAKAEYLGVNRSELELIPESIIDEGSIDLFNISNVGSKHTQVFFIPLDRNKQYLYKLLTRLSSLENKRQFIVYGIPPWDRYDVLLQFFESLEIHLAQHSSIYANTSEFKEFEQLFYDKYKILPQEQAAYAYDLMNTIINVIQKDGVPISLGLIESMTKIGAGSKLDFRPIVAPTGSGKDGVIEYIKNQGILIVD